MVCRGDPRCAPSLTKNLKDIQPTCLLRRRISVPETRAKGSAGVIFPTSAEESGLAGRIRLSMPELPRCTRKSSKAELPISTQNHFDTTDGPSSFSQRGKGGVPSLVVSSIALGALSGKGENSADETKLSRLGGLAVSPMRVFGDFATRFGTGVYDPVLGVALGRQSLGRNPSSWSAWTKSPIAKRISKDVANVSWRFPHNDMRTIDSDTVRSLPSLRLDRTTPSQSTCLSRAQRCGL